MDRFGESARKGFDFLKSRARETVEVSKIGSAIKELEERREQCLIDIGHRVMAMFDGPSLDKEAFRDRVEEVRSLNAELAQTQAEYEAVKSSLKSSVEEILPGHQRSDSSSHPPSSAPQPPDYDRG